MRRGPSRRGIRVLYCKYVTLTFMRPPRLICALKRTCRLDPPNGYLDLIPRSHNCRLPRYFGILTNFLHVNKYLKKQVLVLNLVLVLKILEHGH
jgi:hypothetical protein